jgi:hypothetical protein
VKQFRMMAAILGLLGACFAPSVRADDRNKETRIKINVPLRVQDTILPPGEYIFRLLDLNTNAVVVNIFTSDGTRLETMTGQHAYRDNVGDKCSPSPTLKGISQPCCNRGSTPATTSAWSFGRQRAPMKPSMHPELKLRDTAAKKSIALRRPAAKATNS